MKILTILGTRPEIIRLSRIIPKLDKLSDHFLLHTGQNYDKTLNDVFFQDLQLRNPDFTINSKADTLGQQLSYIFIGVEKILKSFKPDKVLILGDTNTSLCTVLVERLGFPVYHMEAGNRCNDLKVPEEINRKIIDTVSSFNLPYTPGSRENLISEGVQKYRIFETGNPIYEVIKYYQDEWSKSYILKTLNIINNKPLVLATAHRAENVDDYNRVINILSALDEISKKYTVIFSCHPRTKHKIEEFNIHLSGRVLITEPLGFFDFIKLQSLSKCVITDSGTVQEECCLLHVPTVTIRDSTERPETVECGSNIVSGLEKDSILNCFYRMININTNWRIPIGYKEENVSDRVVNFVLGSNFRGN